MKPKARTFVRYRAKMRTRLTSNPSGVVVNPALPKVDPITGRPREGDVWTPCGYTDRPSESYADGKILFYSTSCHGGFFVTADLNQRIPPEFRNALGWYEEDCDWVIVPITFPELLPADMVKQAREQFGTGASG
jgi:hypothetical protein